MMAKQEIFIGQKLSRPDEVRDGVSEIFMQTT